MKNLKKWSALILGLTVLAGITFAFSQNTSLQGLFAPPESITEDSTRFSAASVTRSIDEAATKAEQENVKAQSYANTATTAASSAETAWNDNDSSALSTAQTTAANAASNAQASAAKAQNYADQAQAFYDANYSTWKTAYDAATTLYDAIDSAETVYAKAQYQTDAAEALWIYALAQAYEYDKYCTSTSCGSDWSGSDGSSKNEFIDIYETYGSCAAEDKDNKNNLHSSTCLTEFKNSVEAQLPASTSTEDLKAMSLGAEFTTMNTALEFRFGGVTLASIKSDYTNKATNSSALEVKYEKALDDYDSVGSSAASLESALKDDENYLNAAFTSADSAAKVAAQAVSSENLAESYGFLSCNSLSLNPSSYEMAATDSTAAFSLTTHLSVGAATTSFWISPKNLMAFTLEELTVKVKINGTIQAYPVETYESQNKWAGQLIFKTSGAGTFSKKSSSTRSNPLLVNKTDANDETVSFSGGVEGDTIEVRVKGEQTNCSATFTISQKTPGRDPGSLQGEAEVDDDMDDDGLTTDQETTLGTSDTDADSDDDGLTDYEEYVTYGTNPLDSDTDNDGLSDYAEVKTYGTNPIVSDTDGDGVNDGAEVTAGTDPKVANTKATPVPPEDSDALTPSQLGTLESTDTCTDPFEDTYGQWHEPIICLMSEASVVNGRTSTHFVPDDYATRGEAIKMITRLVLGKSSSDAEGLTSNWNDLSGQWFEPYVLVATDADVVRTRDSFTANELFDGNTSITRGELALFIARAYGLTNYDQEEIFSDVAWSRYDAYAINALSQQKVDLPYDKTDDDVPVVSGYSDGTFRPDNPIARSEAAAMIYRAYLYNHN